MISRSIILGSCIGPTLYIIMNSDIHPLSVINLIFKQANDTSSVVPKNIDIKLMDEYDHIKNWAIINKMFINEVKSK